MCGICIFICWIKWGENIKLDKVEFVNMELFFCDIEFNKFLGDVLIRIVFGNSEKVIIYI